MELLESPAIRSLSVNAGKALNRLKVEHCAHRGTENGRLIVTHENFKAYGVTGRLIADSVDELVFKGLIRVRRGKSADGTPHPSLYRLTFYGDLDGAAPTNEWKGVDEAKIAEWEKTRTKKAFERSAKSGRKKKVSIHEREIARFTNVKSGSGF